MRQGKLFLSFWDICLENLPEGDFRRCSITLADARLLIDKARRQKTLLCLSREDLLAPYHEHGRDNHNELCTVLLENSGIELSISDFFSKDETDGDSCYFTNPLNCMQIQEHDRLLVITCAYGLDGESQGKRLAFKLDPARVQFHLIELL